jgi:hypothetical protein
LRDRTQPTPAERGDGRGGCTRDISLPPSSPVSAVGRSVQAALVRNGSATGNAIEAAERHDAARVSRAMAHCRTSRPGGARSSDRGGIGGLGRHDEGETPP